MASGKSNDRLYQDLARSLLEELAAGRYPVGTRLPAERDLALRFWQAAAADERISAGFRAIAQTNALTVSAL